MDAADEYELDYEAESPPRMSQQVQRGDGSLPSAESPAISGDDESDAEPEAQQEAKSLTTPAQSVSPCGADVETSSQARRRKRPLLGRTDKQTAALVASLTRKLSQSKKRNAELHSQLQRLYQNDAIAFLENKAQERLRQIEVLQMENRTLLHQQRALNKQIEELREEVEAMPTKRIAQRDELRVCREQLRHYKETQRAADEKSAKLHQQVVDLTTANKTLLDKLKHLDHELGSSSSSSSQSSSHRSGALVGQQEAEAVIASQEDVITRLQHRVDVMKKAIKLEQHKHEKQALAAQEELEKARGDLEAFHQRVFEKEKVIRSLFMEIKQLKRSLKDVITHMQLNQQLSQSIGGREMRFANQSSTHLHSSATLRTNDTTAHDMLSKLGLLQLTSSTSKASAVTLAAHATSPRIRDTVYNDHYVPCPPASGSLSEKKTPRSARSHAQANAPTPQSRTNTRTRSADRRDSGGLSRSEPFYEDVDQVTFAPLGSSCTTAANNAEPQTPETDASSLQQDAETTS